MKIAIAATVAFLLWGWYSSDQKISHLQRERNIAHCQVILFEDYSSRVAEQAEMRKCIDNLGYDLKWNERG